jgi:hypothetical protein
MIKIIKQFLTKDEINILNNWTLANYKNKFFRDPGMDKKYKKTRLTTRGKHLLPDNVNYPKEAYLIQEKIQNLLGIKSPLYPHFHKKGIVTGIGFENGSIYSHKDPTYYPETITIHCNFITQKPIGGGITIIEGVSYDIEECDMLMYAVNKLEHGVTPNIGAKERILWCFGFCIPDSQAYEIFK